MTRTVIWETPENREEYAETPCEKGSIENWPDGPKNSCKVKLRDHAASTYLSHPWRIYKQTARHHTLAPNALQHAIANLIELTRQHKQHCDSPDCGVSVYEVRRLLEHFGVEIPDSQIEVFL